eukprot:CAMPEP_0118933694 /NCGR_PEP_ID=MMETSP1169-20130426/12181_1 /TAXON_ID=36882 /ORGANISM="Pyramimonas obovata, Strain CCMP722" /LENGTH=154 /DNA_ID=CAMNT_0006876491 /DNA_START=31 /DNA_END=495 /DNA_ORIENTATION=+
MAMLGWHCRAVNPGFSRLRSQGSTLGTHRLARAHPSRVQISRVASRHRHTLSRRVSSIRAQGKEDNDDESKPSSSPSSSGKSLKTPGEMLEWIQEEWTEYQKPREEGDMRDLVLMGLSLATLVYFSMSLYRVYAALFKMSGAKTIAEMLSGNVF